MKTASEMGGNMKPFTLVTVNLRTGEEREGMRFADPDRAAEAQARANDLHRATGMYHFVTRALYRP